MRSIILFFLVLCMLTISAGSLIAGGSGFSVSTPIPSAFGSNITNLTKRDSIPPDTPEYGYDPNRMWHSPEITPGTYFHVTVEFTPNPVPLDRIVIYTAYGNSTHRAAAGKIFVDQQPQGRDWESPTSEANVQFPSMVGKRWHFHFLVGGSKHVAIRGFRFFSGALEIVPAPPPPPPSSPPQSSSAPDCRNIKDYCTKVEEKQTFGGGGVGPIRLAEDTVDFRYACWRHDKCLCDQRRFLLSDIDCGQQFAQHMNAACDKIKNWGNRAACFVYTERYSLGGTVGSFLTRLVAPGDVCEYVNGCPPP
jgi:hypothetical protein